MGHYSFDYDKVFWYNVTKEEEEDKSNIWSVIYGEQSRPIIHFPIRLSGKLKDYLSVSNQQVSVCQCLIIQLDVLYCGNGNCMRTTVSLSYVKEG
ncbi:hypothetical protein T07_10137 [Trichinella nelsoni]|uniref:Uncharacterized protein n=1 Tax=Trichinella nelsoni TaxID=6336 RepID=A0A0V0SK05_9BILA|nr:hypothetical protein T07_10137 [Trichinella nelsoni]